MADNLTDGEENRLLDLSLPDDGVYLALTSDQPTDSSAGTELTGSGYARQPISMAAAAAGLKSNDTQILYPAASADWLEIQGYNVYDAASGGNRRWYRALSVAERRTVRSGDQYRVAAGNLSFALS